MSSTSFSFPRLGILDITGTASAGRSARGTSPACRRRRARRRRRSRYDGGEQALLGGADDGREHVLHAACVGVLGERARPRPGGHRQPLVVVGEIVFRRVAHLADAASRPRARGRRRRAAAEARADRRSGTRRRRRARRCAGSRSRRAGRRPRGRSTSAGSGSLGRVEDADGLLGVDARAVPLQHAARPSAPLQSLPQSLKPRSRKRRNANRRFRYPAPTNETSLPSSACSAASSVSGRCTARIEAARQVREPGVGHLRHRLQARLRSGW